MTLKAGDILDEKKNNGQSCGLAVKILKGGAGFQKLVCCGGELTEEHKVSKYATGSGRVEGKAVKKGVIIDERKNHPNSCGLRVEVLGGGAGFKEIVCCGNVLTEKDVI